LSRDPIEEFLAQLAQGQKDSQGRFTLGREQAAEKLRRFQLADPNHYVLNVVAAATASGAERLDVRVDADDCEMTLVGGRRPGELDDLLTSLLNSEQPAEELYLRELARAVYGSLGLRPTRVTVTTWDGQSGSELSLRGERQATRALARPPWKPAAAGLRLHVREEFSSQVLGRFLGRLTGAGTPAGDLLQARCRYSPLPVTLNGNALNLAYDLGECRSVLHLDGGHGLRAVWKGNPHQRRKASEGCSAWLGFAPQSQWGKTLLVLVRGVSFPLDPTRVGGVGLRGVILDDRLSKDLSQEKLVEDETFQSMLQQVREAAGNGDPRR